MDEQDIQGATARLQQAVAWHQQGEFRKAEALYAAVLQSDPHNFDALHLSGVLAQQRGEPAQALQLIGRAIALDDSKAIAHCNLGVALQDMGRNGEALASFERALALQPDYPMALSNRGNVLCKLDRVDDALDSYARALALAPTYAEALCNQGVALQTVGRHDEALDSFGHALTARRAYPEALLGAAVSLQALGELGEAFEGYERALKLNLDYAEAWCCRAGLLLRVQEFDEAMESYRRALALRPGYARAQLGLANTLRALQRGDEAVQAYQQALAMGADSETVGYMLASLGVQQAPSASPAAYVRTLFDQYAGKFDHHLLEVLQYRTPALLTDAIRRRALQEAAAAPAGAPAAAAVDVFDIGCGTGLCGALLRPLARRLEGVDLSPQMLERARDLGLYDALHCGEMVEFLRRHPQGADLIVAADVFVYTGDLAPVLAAAHSALRPGGLLAFSVEDIGVGTTGGQGYVLRPSGRYAHSAHYIELVAAAQGFVKREMGQCVLRQENGGDIAGLLVVLSAPA